MQQHDLATAGYWSTLWGNTPPPRPIDPDDRSIRNHVRRSFHEFFLRHIGNAPREGARLLEVGCARSAWLPYFSRHLRYEVAGLDYSDVGCAQARALLEREGITGVISCGDLFAPPTEFRAAFDVVVSFGLVEHFTDTVGVVRALGGFLKPGGILYTVIPNYTGAMGRLHRAIDKRVYEMHVPLSPRDLAETYSRAGLSTECAEYFLSTNFGICNYSMTPAGSLSYYVKAGLWWSLVAASATVWAFEGATGSRLPAKRATSPYVHIVGRASR